MKKCQKLLMSALLVGGYNQCAVAPIHPAPLVQNQSQTVMPVPQPVVAPVPVIPTPVVSQPITPIMPSGSNSKTVITVTQDHHDGKSIQTVPSYSTDEIGHELQESSLDTVDLMTSGNWVLKRAWWEKTEDLYEQLKDIVAKILETRTHYVSQRNEINRTFDICFSEVGIEQGELQDIVSYGKDLLDKEKAQGLVSPEEKAFAEKLIGKERDLEQLKLDIKGIDDIDKKIDEALDVLDTQINVCVKYEHKAWENFKDIARELDDKEARKLYSNTEALFKDIKNIEQYLDHDFTNYFNVMLQAAKDHTQKISAQVNTLKAAGVDLKKESKLLEKQGSDIEKNKLDALAAKKKDEEEKKPKEAVKKEALEKAHWYYPIKVAFVGIKNVGVSLIQIPALASVAHVIHAGWQKVVDAYHYVVHAIMGIFGKHDSSATSTKRKKDEKKSEEKNAVKNEKNTTIDSKKIAAPRDASDKQNKNDVSSGNKEDTESADMSSSHHVANTVDIAVKKDHSGNDIEYYEKPSKHSKENPDANYYGLTKPAAA